MVNVKLRCFQNTRKLQSRFLAKDRQSSFKRYSIVCRLTCSCGASYIGQAQRNLISCVEEHRMSLSSSVCRRVQANPDHRVDFQNPEVIGTYKNWRRMLILESLLIQEHKPELNANIPSMPLCIFNLLQSFMPLPWRHSPSPSACIQLSHVSANASRHCVTAATAPRVSHFSQSFSTDWPYDVTAKSLQFNCKHTDGCRRSYRNLSKKVICVVICDRCFHYRALQHFCFSCTKVTLVFVHFEPP